MSINPTPGRPWWRSGVLLSLAVAIVACDRVSPGATLQLDTTEVTLAPGAEIHDVRIAGAGAIDSIRPAMVEAKVGDVVRFEITDHRTHALAFQAESLSSPARAYLERTHQLRGPPLVNGGALWIVATDSAPPGRYPFFCRSHDGARGVVVLRSSGD